MKVNFIIAGAMKSGTTSLHHLLHSHADVEMAKPKEPQFFSNHIDWKEKLEDYHAYFEEKKGVIYGESSTNYTKYPHIKNLEVVRALQEYNPDMKFIYMIRHPVDRVLSQYMHIYQTGYSKLELGEALRQRPQLLMNSRYYIQIKRYLDVFGRDRIFLIKFEDFIRNQSDFLHPIADFLNIDPEGFSLREIQSNPSEKGEFVHHSLEQLFRANLWLKRVLPEKLIKRTRALLSRINPNQLSEKPSMSREFQEIVLRSTELDTERMEQVFSLDLQDYYDIRKKHLPAEKESEVHSHG